MGLSNSDILIKDRIKIEWEDIGEGLNGEYNPEDNSDIPLLRFYISVNVAPTGYEDRWEDIEGGSYCTLFPTTADDLLKQKALRFIFDHIVDYIHFTHYPHDPVEYTAGFKQVLERMSYITPEWVK